MVLSWLMSRRAVCGLLLQWGRGRGRRNQSLGLCWSRLPECSRSRSVFGHQPPPWVWGQVPLGLRSTQLDFGHSSHLWGAELTVQFLGLACACKYAHVSEKVLVCACMHTCGEMSACVTVFLAPRHFVPVSLALGLKTKTSSRAVSIFYLLSSLPRGGVGSLICPWGWWAHPLQAAVRRGQSTLSEL